MVHHRLLWERCILEEVMREDSVWHDLYLEDSFHVLSYHIYTEIPWEALGEVLQEALIKKSLRSVEVPAGTFMMGALPDDGEASVIEKPRHEVTLTKGMSVCVYACTQGLYTSVMGKNPSKYKGSMRPVSRFLGVMPFCFATKVGEREVGALL